MTDCWWGDPVGLVRSAHRHSPVGGGGDGPGVGSSQRCRVGVVSPFTVVDSRLGGVTSQHVLPSHLAVGTRVIGGIAKGSVDRRHF